MQKLDMLFQQIRAELGSDFVAMDIVGLDGLSIDTASAINTRDDASASARTVMIMKLAEKVSDKLGLSTVDDFLITTDKVYILFRFIGDNSYIWGLTIRRDAILGSARMIMNEYAPQLWDAIPH
jgi:predicted regulator of Ras-like GTPase activity (Roadblock/LC7/MglB family)